MDPRPITSGSGDSNSMATITSIGTRARPTGPTMSGLEDPDTLFHQPKKAFVLISLINPLAVSHLKNPTLIQDHHHTPTKEAFRFQH
jgi:hypothetical protein